jgi:catechol-2,3-dioxygenase
MIGTLRLGSVALCGYPHRSHRCNESKKEIAMAQQNDIPTPPRAAVTPVGINHLVLHVRNLQESHAFWTAIMGLK